MRPPLVLAAVVVLAAPAVHAQPPPQVAAATVVLFNTVCAECHELECSGRLSFRSGAEGARNHLERHAGPLTATEVAGLWALLDYTKRSCAYVAPETVLPNDGVWRADMLGGLALPSRRASFVPLGVLPAGPHGLYLDYRGGTPLRVEVLTDEAAVLDLDVTTATARLTFVLTAPQAVFVRLRAREPFEVDRLAID